MDGKSSSMKHRYHHPLYQYAIQKRDEGCKKLIYHYTNVESFFHILNSMSLRISVFAKSDDLNEANVANVDRIGDARTLISLESFIKARCSYLSFVQDGDVGLGESEGTNHPRMWSQYAQRGYGVCLALDEHKFFKINEERFRSKFFKFEPVQYEYKNGASVTIDAPYADGEEESIIRQYYQELFFKKHIDWKEENEKRLFGIDLPEFLSIFGALEFICLGPKFLKDETMMTKLLDFLTASNSSFYGYLVPQSFADITPYDYGYFSDGALAASEIVRRLRMWERYKKYIDDWCKDDT